MTTNAPSPVRGAASDHDLIVTPGEHDVLCGRGGASNHHHGNAVFRAVVARNKAIYNASPKTQKIVIARAIVEAVRRQQPPGRFLVYDKRSNGYREIAYKKSVEKTSQALREKGSNVVHAANVRGDGRNDRPTTTATTKKKEKKGGTAGGHRRRSRVHDEATGGVERRDDGEEQEVITHRKRRRKSGGTAKKQVTLDDARETPKGMEDRVGGGEMSYSAVAMEGGRKKSRKSSEVRPLPPQLQPQHPPLLPRPSDALPPSDTLPPKQRRSWILGPRFSLTKDPLESAAADPSLAATEPCPPPTQPPSSRRMASSFGFPSSSLGFLPSWGWTSDEPLQVPVQADELFSQSLSTDCSSAVAVGTTGASAGRRADGTVPAPLPMVEHANDEPIPPPTTLWSDITKFLRTLGGLRDSDLERRRSLELLSAGSAPRRFSELEPIPLDTVAPPSTAVVTPHPPPPPAVEDRPTMESTSLKSEISAFFNSLTRSSPSPTSLMSGLSLAGAQLKLVRSASSAAGTSLVRGVSKGFQQWIQHTTTAQAPENLVDGGSSFSSSSRGGDDQPSLLDDFDDSEAEARLRYGKVGNGAHCSSH